ncbi:MAG: hemin uptake protein HemP [Pseudomonadota bacterium]
MGSKLDAIEPTASNQPRVILAEQLFGEEQEVRIHFKGQEYRLRKTRNGKLILTK